MTVGNTYHETTLGAHVSSRTSGGLASAGRRRRVTTILKYNAVFLQLHLLSMNETIKALSISRAPAPGARDAAEIRLSNSLSIDHTQLQRGLVDH